MKKGKVTKEKLLNSYKDIIFELYQNGNSLKDIAQKYNVDSRTISAFIRENSNIEIRPGAPKRKYEVDETVFEKIDSEEKAYVLGFLYADGCITKDNSRLSITVSSVDEDILTKIKTLLKTNIPIRHEDGGLIKNTNYYGKPTSNLTVNSVKICKDLNKWRVFQHKTLKLTFPQFLPCDLIFHFIRGYFDGDGCITFSRKNVKASMVGNKEFLDKIQETFIQYNINAHIYQRKNSEVFSFEINAKNEVAKFLNQIYGNASIYLDRKFQRYVKYTQGKQFSKY